MYTTNTKFMTEAKDRWRIVDDILNGADLSIEEKAYVKDGLDDYIELMERHAMKYLLEEVDELINHKGIPSYWPAARMSIISKYDL